MAERLCLHSVGRKPLLESEELLEHFRHLLGEWHLAWRQLDLRVWGVLHGLFQIIEKMFGWQKVTTTNLPIRVARIAITFTLVTIAWIFFRQPTIADAFGVIERIVTEHGALFKPSNTEVEFSALSIGIVACVDLLREFLPKRFYQLVQAPVVVRWCVYYALLLIVLLSGVFDSSQFIYVSF